jgi:hypothetical protein
MSSHISHRVDLTGYGKSSRASATHPHDTLYYCIPPLQSKQQAFPQSSQSSSSANAHDTRTTRSSFCGKQGSHSADLFHGSSATRLFNPVSSVYKYTSFFIAYHTYYLLTFLLTYIVDFGVVYWVQASRDLIYVYLSLGNLNLSTLAVDHILAKRVFFCDHCYAMRPVKKEELHAYSAPACL